MASLQATAVLGRDGRSGRAGLRWLTVCGPASYLTVLSVGVLYYHPHPLPPFWPAFVILLTLSAVGTFVFSRFVFDHVRRQEDEILRRTADLADANQAMAVVKERQRLARELHDSVAQHLGYLHLRLADVERQLAAGSTARLAGDIADLKRVAREAYEEARQAILELRSMVSRSLRFVPTLTEYLHDWSRQTGVAVDLKVEAAGAITPPPPVEVQLIRIIQEALANVRKHARARRVIVRVEQRADALAVTIGDDGVGFDPRGPAAPEPAFGVATMRERAEGVGGRLRIDSTPGDGTTVEVELPLSEPRR